MRSRFAAYVRAPSAPLRGAGAPTRKSASRKRLGEEEVAAERLRLNNFDLDSGKDSSDRDEGSATRRNAINPAHPYGVPRRFAVPSAGFDSAALCGVLNAVGTKHVPESFDGLRRVEQSTIQLRYFKNRSVNASSRSSCAVFSSVVQRLRNCFQIDFGK